MVAGGFLGVCGGRDEGRYLTVFLLFFFWFLEDGEQES